MPALFMDGQLGINIPEGSGPLASGNDRFWHFADVPGCLLDVRYRGQPGHSRRTAPKAEIRRYSECYIVNLTVSAVASTTGQEGPSAWVCSLAQRQVAAEVQ
jgi:hypothetical protein